MTNIWPKTDVKPQGIKQYPTLKFEAKKLNICSLYQLPI